MPEIEQQALDDLTAKATALDSAIAAAELANNQLAHGVERYRTTLAATDARIPADAITGETFDAVDASIASARRIADAAVQHAAAQTPTPPTATPPTGTPPTRDTIDTSGMSPIQKIAAGLNARR